MESKGTVTRVPVFTNKAEEKLKNFKLWRAVVDEEDGETVMVKIMYFI